ncbi:OB-fold-containig protein [Martelella limonii]|uniref:OB-fold-containig protein n=1 Tax=Martelella limonii TaxID=1647649 RepID=UPI00157FCAD5|nr:OB-fold-containig protein [Martelella limonii]
MDLFLSQDSLPFAVAAIMLFALVGIELVCLMIGFSVGETVDNLLPDDHGDISGLMSWLNVGRVPVLILIMLMLGLFSMAGFVIQIGAGALWSPLPSIVASLAALVLALPAVRVSSRWVARIVPKDETYAVDLADLIGRIGEVTVGPLDQGLPGRVKLQDQHGNWHVLRARAAGDQVPIMVGAPVLVVDLASGVFLAIPAPPDLLSS